MKNNNSVNNKYYGSGVLPIYMLLGGFVLGIINYILILNNTVIFYLIIATPMLLLLGLVGLISPEKVKSNNTTILISAIGIIIGIIIFYYLVY